MPGRNCAPHPIARQQRSWKWKLNPAGWSHSFCTAPARKARRDISSWSFVQATVDAGIPNHRLNVISGFCEGYRLHKSGHVTVGEVRPPLRHSAVAGIIGRERILDMPVIVI